MIAAKTSAINIGAGDWPEVALAQRGERSGQLANHLAPGAADDDAARDPQHAQGSDKRLKLQTHDQEGVHQPNQPAAKHADEYRQRCRQPPVGQRSRADQAGEAP